MSKSNSEVLKDFLVEASALRDLTPVKEFILYRLSLEHDGTVHSLLFHGPTRAKAG